MSSTTKTLGLALLTGSSFLKLVVRGLPTAPSLRSRYAAD